MEDRGDRPAAGPARSARQTRADRLAEALKANLRRRKQQARERRRAGESDKRAEGDGK